MKRESRGTTGAPTTKKEVFNAEELELNVDFALGNAKVVGKGRTAYPLRGGVTLTIQETEHNFDLAHLNIYGLDVSCFVRTGKNGAFLSYPSHKEKDGEYKEDVICYSKSLNTAIKDLLSRLYK